jgi:flagellar protein FlaG
MIDGINSKVSSGSMPSSDVRKTNQPHADAEKIKKEEEKIVNTEDQAKQDDTNTARAMDRIINAARFFNREIQLEMERESDTMIVKVVDSESGEVIRQIPPEELLALSKNADELKGFLIDKEG